MKNALSIDVEEYFHPTEVQRSVPVSEWSRLPSKVEAATDRILELLDLQSTKATFFVLGWVAAHYSALVRRIAEAGHEIGCHSYAHRLIYELTPAQFREDTQRATIAIGDAVGSQPRMYRAPSFSITPQSLWALEILVECGFHGDSSIYPIAHDRYGFPGFGRHAQVLQTPAGPILEIPIATAQVGRAAVPVGGGAYLRLLPYSYTAAGIRRINRQEKQPACIYVHPWELDEAQPRIASGRLSRLRTYTGIKGMQAKLVRLMQEFQFVPVSSVYADLRNHIWGGAATPGNPKPASFVLPEVAAARKA